MITLSDLWRELVDLGAWTGVSAGVIALLLLVALYVPLLRLLAVALAVAVTVGYISGVYMHQVGRTEVTAEWDAANAKADAEAKARDKRIAASVKSKYGPVIASRGKTIADLHNRVAAYERELPAKTPSACALGADALRLRNSR